MIPNLARRILATLAVLFFVFTARAQDCSRPLADGLSWWPGEGSATDLIGPNPGTLIGDAGFGPGWVGQSFIFDGTDDQVAIPFNASYDFQLPSQFSIAAWVRVADGPGAEFVVRGLPATVTLIPRAAAPAAPQRN